METFKLNEVIVLFLNRWANSSLYSANLVVFSAVFLGWLLVAVLYFRLYRSRHRFFRSVIFTGASALLALFLADIIKAFYPLPRPGAALREISLLFAPADQASFPSIHAAFLGGLAISFFKLNKDQGKYFIILALVVSFARVAAGVHWPLDILGGFLVAYIATWTVGYAFKMIKWQ